MMIYLQVENISKSYGDKTILDDISFGVFKSQKCGIVAKNGSGKTTLLDIIYGIASPDSGQVVFRNEIKTGYLQQEPLLDEQLTILEEVLSFNNEYSQTINDYYNSLEDPEHYHGSELFNKMESMGLWDLEAKVKSVLMRLKVFQIHTKTGLLSGGEKKRVALAKELLKNPDFLILDEPTNHLDLEIIEWLEKYLSESGITLLMVTHDRYFLDRICNQIIEIDRNKVFQYKGNYSYFLKKREERINALTAEINSAKNLLRTEEEWMRRMPKARSHKSKSRIDNYYELKKTASQNLDQKDLKIDIESKRLGKKIINLKDIHFSYDQLNLIEDFYYKFIRNEKVGIIGPNGSGKTTFLKILTGELHADKGKVEIGETIKIGYYKQEGIRFNEQDKVIDIISNIAESITIRSGVQLSAKEFLTYFLFPPEMHYVKVAKLSGGEKRRLYLLTVLMQKPNFLILDEPTNDLDIMTLGVLEDFLEGFNGSVVIVSHDRFFMDNIVDHLFVFDACSGKIDDFPGNYSQYREKYKNTSEKRTPKEVPVKKKKGKIAPVDKNTQKKPSYKEKREFEKLSEEIEQLEEKKKELENEISSGKLDHDQLQKASLSISEIIELLDKKTDRWLELSDFF